MRALISLFVTAATFTATPSSAFNRHDMMRYRIMYMMDTRSCEGCDLSGANLTNADLSEVNLTKADLSKANLANARLRGANLTNADLSEVNLTRANLSNANLTEATISPSADLTSAYLANADLTNANLRGATLTKANMMYATLTNANLSLAFLSKANMHGANLTGANMFSAMLNSAELTGVNLTDANLFGSNLRNTVLVGVRVGGAKLASSQLNDAAYAPNSPPPYNYIGSVSGLTTIRVPYNDVAGQANVLGLVQLREFIQKSGPRQLERQATYAIERNQTLFMIATPGAIPGIIESRADRLKQLRLLPDPLSIHDVRWNEPFSLFEGMFRLILFEWTVGYGLYPGRALTILLSLAFIMPLAYLRFIDVEGSPSRTTNGIYRVWPDGRLIVNGASIEVRTYDNAPAAAHAEKLCSQTRWGAIGYAIYFSLLSAFNIGWRDLNVGAWLTKMQTTEYTLRAIGLPRTLSGIQSLISVYLIAIWILTYFGRPFQ